MRTLITALIAYLVHVGSDQVVQFVEDAVDDFDQQMALLVLQCGGHEQGEDLVEQGARSKLTSLVCDLPQRRLQKAQERGSDITVNCKSLSI